LERLVIIVIFIVMPLILRFLSVVVGPDMQ
jgi:hypothetical protein